jgi:small GTP-binding protein
MGVIFGKYWKTLFSKKHVRILMLGLDGAGKTTIIYNIKLNETVRTIPTIGFNVETIEYKGLSMTMWDVGGQEKLRALWEHYFQGTDCLIFVVDSSDRERIEIAKEEFQRIVMDNELENAIVLVYANKQDLPGAMSPQEISEKLELNSMKKRKWLVQGSSASRGDGIKEGFEWIAKELLKK